MVNMVLAKHEHVSTVIVRMLQFSIRKVNIVLSEEFLMNLYHPEQSCVLEAIR